MGRRRLEKHKNLPLGMRCREGYFSFKNPLDGKEYGLGRDRRRAIQEVRQALARFKPNSPDPGMQTAEEVLARAIPIDGTCGIYVLIMDESIVYVGQSVNIHARIAQHICDGVHRFNRYHVIPCDIANLDSLETAYIGALNPVGNRLRYLSKTTVCAGDESEGIGEARLSA